MPHQRNEKSPVPVEDFEGLQLDTRARDADVHLDERKRQGMLDDDFDDQMNYINEKQSNTGHDPTSPSSTYVGTMTSPVHQTPGMSAKQFENNFGAPTEEVPPPPQKDRRICGLRPGMFWFLAGLTLALVIAAALVGGIVGGLQSKHHNASTPPPSSNVSTGPSFPAASQSDVMIGSPLNIVSYSLDNSKVSKREQDLSQLQAYRAYYQSLKGDIKEAILSGSSWQSASPIFTDALNNTGLASLSYLNGSQQQGSIFYTGANGLLQEKRRAYSASDSVYWEPGTLNSLNIPMIGNLGYSSDNNDPMNDWNGYRIAAAYSTHFKATGAGARVFCHAQHSNNGSTYVQELVWSQKNDTWAQGATILGISPESSLAATIDESLGILRLFYSAGDNTLQESYMSLSDQSGAYRKGVHLPNLLTTNTADIAAVSSNGSTFIFHYTNASSTTSGGSVTGIQQFTISGSPATANEAFNLSQSLVAAPSYPQGINASLYQPLAASVTSVQGLSEALMVMWADAPVGDPSSNITGYGQLSQLTRQVGNATWDANAKVAVPLGNKNSQDSG